MIAAAVTLTSHSSVQTISGCLRKNRVQPIRQYVGFIEILGASRREKERDIFGQFFKTGVSYFCREFGDAFMCRMRSLPSIQSQPKHFGGNFLQRHEIGRAHV